MNRTFLVLAAAAGLLLSARALADGTNTGSASPVAIPDDAAGESAMDALKDKAAPPATAPALPASASDRATWVHEHTAFGKKGEAERMAHSQAGKKGADDADAARADAANRAAMGAAMRDAGSANADAHNAAGMARSEAARQGGLSGSMNPGKGRK